MGFRGKQIATLTLVAGTVALATSLMSAASLARLAVAETQGRAELLAEALYHQASRVLRQAAAEDLATALANDAALRNYVEAVVGYSPTTLYLAITDVEGRAILHSDPRREGTILPPAEPLDELARRSALRQLWALGRGHRVLETVLPFRVDGEPFGTVRVAVSTLLLRERLAGAIAANAALAAGVVLVAFVASFYLANRLLAPIEMLRRELARIDPGQGEPPLDLRTEADVGRVAEFFAAMSRRLAEARSRASESSWLETMLGGLTDAVLVVGADGRILSANPPASRLVGAERDGLTGEDLEAIVGPAHPLARIVREALDRGEAVAARPVRLRVGEREVLQSVSAQVLRASETVSGVMVSVRDMEKLSRLGSHLSYSQKLAALGRLTSGVAHEIKNPLNAMAIHVALLRQKLAAAEGVGPDAREYLDVLEGEIRRLDRVIQGFLKFTRPEELQLDAVPVAEMIGEVLRLVAGKADRQGVRVRCTVDEGLPPVYGDRELLQQALLNLMLNACEAMPEGGELTVRASRGEDGRLRVEVADTGVGIDPGALPRIFDLYYTTKEGGSGIGLSMVYRIVQLHDGEVTVDSSPGAGSRFTITLPEAPE